MVLVRIRLAIVRFYANIKKYNIPFDFRMFEIYAVIKKNAVVYPRTSITTILYLEI